LKKFKKSKDNDRTEKEKKPAAAPLSVQDFPTIIPYTLTFAKMLIVYIFVGTKMYLHFVLGLRATFCRSKILNYSSKRAVAETHFKDSLPHNRIEYPELVHHICIGE
jgi:hypothetical protein